MIFGTRWTMKIHPTPKGLNPNLRQKKPKVPVKPILGLKGLGRINFILKMRYQKKKFRGKKSRKTRQINVAGIAWTVSLATELHA